MGFLRSARIVFICFVFACLIMAIDMQRVALVRAAATSNTRNEQQHEYPQSQTAFASERYAAN